MYKLILHPPVLQIWLPRGASLLRNFVIAPERTFFTSGILREERNFSFLIIVPPEKSMTKKNSAPRARFRLVETGLM
jgi:hypothetical protein